VLFCIINGENYLAELGQIEQAQVHMKEYLNLANLQYWGNVNGWEAYFKNRFQNPVDMDRILNAMHKAGMRRWQ
jgi:hypothetical protein